jgi:hypothetical protein
LTVRGYGIEMPRTKKPTLVELTPKNETAKTNLGYHGDRWINCGAVEVVRFSREKNWYRLVSKDGKKSLFVKVNDDPGYSVRLL